MEGMKRCSKCGEWKEANRSFFYPNKTGKNGLQNHCKECDNKKGRKYYQKNIIKMRERSSKWKKNNPEKRRKQSRRYKTKYPKKNKEEYRIAIKKMRRDYIRGILKRLGFNINKITEDLVDQKRKQPLWFREIKKTKEELKNGIDRGGDSELDSCSEIVAGEKMDLATFTQEIKASATLNRWVATKIVADEAEHSGGKSALRKWNRQNLISETQAIDMEFEALDEEKIKCLNTGKIMLRAECLEYSGAHYDECSKCEVGTDCKKLLLPEPINP